MLLKSQNDLNHGMEIIAVVTDSLTSESCLTHWGSWDIVAPCWCAQQIMCRPKGRTREKILTIENQKYTRRTQQSFHSSKQNKA